ncbi:MAG: HU family DNA-binding protein [Okeania sp. SIO1H6]|uniref:HU family DNA-binding protein n=1 Tax=Dapis sp. BLCC M229 TaxID=3400188 RepID=UPI0013C5C652|nr:HU family DNA-binding protein [Okeania sp. SIO1H6]
MSINKKELIKRVSQQVNYDSQVVEEVINATLDEIYQCLKEGESVRLRDFGSFYIQVKKGKTSVFKFNPSQKLRKLFGWSSTYKGEN